MPQLTQLADVVLSQLFWMALVLGFLFFVVGRGMVPKIMATVDERDARIAADLEAAEKAKAAADAVEEAYRERMDASRGEAAKLTLAAKDKGARATEKKVAAADAELEAKANAAAEAIRANRKAAMAEIEALATDLALEVTERVSGLKANRAAAADAVKEALHG